MIYENEVAKTLLTESGYVSLTDGKYHDAVLGRFITIDALAESSYFVNPYTYCLNNPFNRVDPSGLASHYNWDSQWYEDEHGNEVAWESVQQEYEITESPSNDDPPTGKEVNAEPGAAPKVSTEVPTLGKATAVAPALPWWALTGEILGKATMRYFGSYFFIITLLQSDTDGPPAYVKEAKDSKANQKHGDDGRAFKKGIEESVN